MFGVRHLQALARRILLRALRLPDDPLMDMDC